MAVKKYIVGPEIDGTHTHVRLGGIKAGDVREWPEEWGKPPSWLKPITEKEAVDATMTKMVERDIKAGQKEEQREIERAAKAEKDGGES